MIAITFALPAESQEFLRSLGNKSRDHRNGIRIIRGKVDDRTIEVFHTGVGKNVCRERVGKFLQDQHFDYLISAGFAGALNDQLQLGDLLLAKNFSTVRLEENFSLSSFPIHMGDLLTVPALIDSRGERNKLALTSGAVAVDMETEFIARACAAHGIPVLSLRVISDTPKELFPAPANIFLTSNDSKLGCRSWRRTLLRIHIVSRAWFSSLEELHTRERFWRMRSLMSCATLSCSSSRKMSH